MTIWKPVLGYEGFYEVGNNGQVRSVDHMSSSGRQRKGRILRPIRMRAYLGTQLSRDGRVRKQAIHKTVLEAFVGPRPDGMQACHGNGDSADNRLENLRWDTPAENISDRDRHGTTARGERSGIVKLTTRDVQSIRSYAGSGLSNRQIGERFGIGRSQVERIIKRQTWKHVDG